MSQDLKDLQTGPVLTLDPFLGEKKKSYSRRSRKRM